MPPRQPKDGRRPSGSRRPAGRQRQSAAPARGMAVRRTAQTPSPEASDGDTSPESGESGLRLQKFLATAGVDSRRNCEQYIRDGRVTVDGDVIVDPAFAIDPATHDIRLDGEKLRMPKLRYFLLNKPKGVLCTNRDPQGRPVAVDLIPVEEQRLFTVGRLDENTEGLLIITNDGDLSDRLAHPRYEVVRRYQVQVAGIPSTETLSQLRQGMYFSDGYFRFRRVRMLKRRGRSTVLELELREGKNREIRRLLARVGHKVTQLTRVAFGPVELGHLPPGRFRELRPVEIRDLKSYLYQLETGRLEEQLAVRKPPRIIASADANRKKKSGPRNSSPRKRGTGEQKGSINKGRDRRRSS
ncbi:MAG: rRNA pseudouridine synthase [Planctomycetaceae bacterium]|nr:rRNA pseudouridine synthase [Planctomycetaceae bacterium]